MASAVRQIGIRMVVDAQSVTTEVPRAAREFAQLGTIAEGAAARTTRSLGQIGVSVRDLVVGAAGLHLVSGGLTAIANAITAMPRAAFDYSKNLEVSQIGMAGILGSMTAINGQQTDYNTALRISSEYIRKLNDDALRTAATSQELTTVFQALLAPGLSARMTLDEIRQLTVVGTNAVKSMGLDAGQVVQELRDLVAGGITPASSTLAGALGLKDSDIAKAKASTEGLFSFLMQRLQGFKMSSEAFDQTLKGRIDQLKEGATRVAAEGLEPLVLASKEALGEVSKLFVTIGEGGKVTLNRDLVDGIREYATAAAQAMAVGREWAGVVWDNREAALALGAVWASVKLGNLVADTVAATAAKMEMTQASRLAAAQAAAEAASNTEVAVTSRAKLAGYLAELQAKVAGAQAEAAAQAAQLATLATTKEAIALSRAEVVSKMDATRSTIAQTEAQLMSVRTTMAQAEAQLAAARSAGALSYALAAAREATATLNATQAQQIVLTADLTAAQARHALLMTELATLGKQQAGVQAAVTAATAAQTAATNAAATAAGTLTAAQGAASVAGRALSGVMGFLGGPIGAITTALTLGVTAWSLWSSAGSNAEKTVRSEVSRSTAEIIADLDKQIDKLEKRNALAAAGMVDAAKKGGEAAEKLAELQSQISNLQNGKGVEGGAALPEAARVDLLQKLLVQYGTLAGAMQRAEEAQAGLDKGAGNLTLTVTGAEQAWKKSVEGIKTASAIQEEYETKLRASTDAWKTFRAALEASNASPETIKARQKEQDQVEASLAAERDKKIKELGASAATATAHSIDAQIAAVQHGYKLLAAKTADGLDEIEALRQRDQISEYTAVQRKAALQAQDIAAQQEAMRVELRLLQGKKDSAKERANLEGQLAELEQKRLNVQTAAARDLETLLIKPQLEQVNALRQGTDAIHEQAAALEAQNRVHGLGAAALQDLIIAQLEKRRLDLEATDNVIPGYIEQVEREIAAHKRLRAAMADKASKDWASEQAEAAVKANEKATEAVERENAQLAQSLTDNLMRGGKTAAEYLEDTFRALVLRPVISAIMQPVSLVINGITGGAMQALGLAGSVAGSGGSGGGLGMLGNISSLASLGSSAGMFGTAAGYGASALFAGNGFAALGGAANMIGAGSFASGFGMAAGVLGPIALGVGALMALAKATKGETRIGGQFGVAYGGEVDNHRRGQTYTYQGQQYDRDFSNGERLALNNGEAYRLEGDPLSNEDTIRKAVAGTAKSIDDMLKALGSQARLTSFSAGLETSDKNRGGVFSGGRLSNGETFGETGEGDNYAGTLYEVFSTRSPDYKTAVENMSLDLKQVAIQALQKVSDIPATIKKMVDGVDAEKLTAEGVDELLTAINVQITGVTALKDSLKSMGLDKLAGMSFDAAAGLAELSGGFETLQGNLNGYYSNFFSAEERRNNLQHQMQDQLSTLDLKLPDINADDARDQYRRLIEAQDDTTESGRKNIAMLLALQGAFASVTVSGDELAARELQRAQTVEDKRWDLQQRTLIAEGKEREALDLRRLKEYYGLLALNPALAEMAIQLYKAEDAATAARQAEEDRQAAEAARANATDKAYAVFEKSVGAAQEAIQAEIELRDARVTSGKALVDLARTQARELRGQVAETAALSAAQGNAAIEAALAALRTGQHFEDDGGLSDAVAAARAGITESAYSNRLDYEAAQLMLANRLEEIGDLGQAQLSTDELLLRAAKAEAERLDQMLKDGKDALDIARGQYVGILDLGTAVRNLHEALVAEKPGTALPGSGSGTGSGGAVFGGTAGGDVQSTRPSTAPAKYFDLQYLGTAGVGRVGITDASITARLDALAPTYHSFDGTGDLGGLMAAMQAQGATLRDMSRLSGYWESDWAKVQAMVGSNLPSFDVGINRVPHDMRAQIHADEAVIPARYNPFNPGAQSPWGSSNAQVADAIQKLTTQHYDIGRETLATLKEVGTTLRKFDGIGIKQRAEKAVSA